MAKKESTPPIVSVAAFSQQVIDWCTALKAELYRYRRLAQQFQGAHADYGQLITVTDNVSGTVDEVIEAMQAIAEAWQGADTVRALVSPTAITAALERLREQATMLSELQELHQQ